MPKKVKIELDFDIDDIVYLKTDPDQRKRQVIEVHLLPASIARYRVACGETISDHYINELSDKPDPDMKQD